MDEKDKWLRAQEWESSWWGDCADTLSEELKQIEYAERMGLNWTSAGSKLFIDAKGKSILDIGCGPVSMLLKVVNSPKRIGIDPCNYPEWVKDRYETSGITFIRMAAEMLDELAKNFDLRVDEVWVYNCLQHVQDPEKIIKNAKKLGKKLRLFEWIEKETNVGHPHMLKADKLQEWVGGKGNVTVINRNGAVGLAYFGEFDL